MVLPRINPMNMKKTGTPLSEMTRDKNEFQRPKSIWVPAEQQAVLNELIEIKKVLIEIRESLKRV